MPNTVDTIEKLTKEQFEQADKFRKLYYGLIFTSDNWSISNLSPSRQSEWYRYSTGEELMDKEDRQKSVIAELEKEKNAK